MSDARPQGSSFPPAGQPRQELPAAPYVGMRSLRRNEAQLLCGREQDARALTDQVFSSRMMLLYAQSGVGKSSLLKAEVIPRLGENDAEVVYHDAWGGEGPLVSLKASLIARLEQLGVTGASAGAPSLVELVRLLAESTQSSVVLILDQFEECLSRHADRLAPLQRELAELVGRSGGDAHVMLSLREEFLAALEPFRGHMLGLFASTYRLEALGDAAVREAIERPAQAFGAAWDAQALDRLMLDLHAFGASQQAPIPLPFVQLVCRQLWLSRSESERSSLTLAHYAALGGARGALTAYVRSVMPRSVAAQRITAELLRYLAPPSGLKMAYTAADLVALTGFEPDTVQAELERLCGERDRAASEPADARVAIRILKRREYGRESAFELYHDALIEVLTPFRNAVFARLHKARMHRRIGLAVIGFLLLLSGAVWGVSRRQQHYSAGEGRLRQACAQPSRERTADSARVSLIEGATSYLLHGQTDASGIAEVGRLLQKYLSSPDDCLPANYGLDASLRESVPLGDDDWPVELHYSTRADRPDVRAFARAWRRHAQELTQVTAIPVPARLHFVADDTLPPNLYLLTGSGLHVEFWPPRQRRGTFIHEPDPDSRAGEFFQRFVRADPRLQRIDVGGVLWWPLPSWSLPVWKVSGLATLHGAELAPEALFRTLLADPTRLLGEPSIEYLLDRTAIAHPAAVAEARCARGDGLRHDLAKALLAEGSLGRLPRLLERLAEQTATGRSDLVHGPWQLADVSVWCAQRAEGVRVGRRARSVERQGLDEMAAWLPEKVSDIHVSVSRDFVRAIGGGDGKGDLREQLQARRAAYHHETGFVLPNISPREDESLPAGASFKITLPLGSEAGESSEILRADPQQPLSAVDAALRAGLARHWGELLDLEQVERARQRTPPEVRTWLERRYTLTDLKRILRASLSNISAPSHEAASSEVPGLGNGASGLRQADRLLASLVFWSAFHGQTSAGSAQRVGELGRDLQAMFVAAPAPSRAASAGRSGSVRRAIRAGVRALGQGQVARAEHHFESALRRDREFARSEFLLRSRALSWSPPLARLLEACAHPRELVPDLAEAAEVSDLLQASRAHLTHEQRRQLRLCAFARHSEAEPRRRLALASQLLADGDFEWFAADDARWFALSVLKQYDDRLDGPALGDLGFGVLEQGLRDADADARGGIFARLFRLCRRSDRHADSARGWCWRGLQKLVPRYGDEWAKRDLTASLAPSSADQRHAARK